MTARVGQLGFAVGGVTNRRLFSEHFLHDLLPSWPEYQQLEPGPLLAQLRELWEAEREGLAIANEAQTEERFIRPVLKALGFHYDVQAGLRFAGGRRQPDYALFASDAQRAEAARREGQARYQGALAVADAKRFDRPLELARSSGERREDPVAQIISYVSITRCPWGILTNGRLWRLYAEAGDLVEGACLEVDLIALLESSDEQQFRIFQALFSAASFMPDDSGRSFLDRALAESRASSVEVGRALERQVFDAVPLIAEGLLGEEGYDQDALDAAFQHALVLLYRLLFCLHAEARALLPVDNEHYRGYSLRNQKQELAQDIDRGRVFSSRSDDLYNDLTALFNIVNFGDAAIGVNEYDGGLFSAARFPFFEGRSVPDHLLALGLDRLYRVGGEFVDYRNLSIRDLGTIYEKLLAHRLTLEDGRLALEPDPRRRESGSFFTPEPIVDAIVERTLDPLLARISAKVQDEGLSGEKALEAFLQLRVLDPAMGSAHFLVSACSRIATYIATDPGYEGEGTLDREELQRLVAERCLYGVDVNPLAVELARLSLWLNTARGDEPLTFLGNLRVGNSLVGADLDDLLSGEESLLAERLSRDAETLLSRVSEIASRPSESGDDVHWKEETAAAAEALRDPLEELADETVRPGFSDDPGPLFHWELEFPEVFLRPDGTLAPARGFDAIVGNPPYIRIQALGRDLADYCRGRYEVARGSFDAYIVFLERSIELLAPGGRLGFIVPNKLTKLDNAGSLRELLASRRLVEEFVDFGDTQVFEGATNYTCLLILDREGHDELEYRRPDPKLLDLQRVASSIDAVDAQPFSVADFGDHPWILVSGSEKEILDVAKAGAPSLGDLTQTIFTGLQTSADPVYIVENRGRVGDCVRVYSRASERELELEPDLLHSLASGSEVDRYAFRPLDSLLLFPYERVDDGMRLLSERRLVEYPLTHAYLTEHEEELRGREGGRLDHAGWYAFGRTQSLALHDLPKLGVAATVRRLEIAADPAGEVYFHNVRVNGILPSSHGPSLWALLTLLNSQLLDYVFRRGAAEHANDHFAANKQFIAPLPIRVPQSDQAEEIESLGRRLHELSVDLGGERRGFLDWVAGALEARLREVSGHTKLVRYDELTTDELLALLQRDRGVREAASTRAFRDRLIEEHRQSVERVADLRSSIASAEASADDLVFDLYGLTTEQRELVASEYSQPS